MTEEWKTCVEHEEMAGNSHLLPAVNESVILLLV